MSYSKADDATVGIAVRGVQPSYARELDINNDDMYWKLNRVPWIRNVGLVEKFGKFYKCVDPGLVKVNPATEAMKKVDITIQVTEVPKQDVITKATYNVTDVGYALVERASTSLRDVCGGHSVQDLIENREAVSEELHEIIGPIAKSWGVKIESTLIKDITLSKELQMALSSAAEAKRLGESRVITSKAEVEAAKLMRDAADILNTPAAIQIRYLETLQAMSRNSSGTKTIFVPLPPAQVNTNE
ncbi:uncharacterized protein B0P05DRAFT_579087 [Gilbertella persicaria]|uniref:uncharacterized protein n=1 Tax=Gilbertella persicaria TaxID=101096 RepID=UPI002220DDA0|nr:uncharacterized protein B0P05DRAFT_579087 [Gilbertella persicaria]KAI8080138.1 hypothetical protein B0P05DRAFT_579087 [Gilbertella persicaria]